MKSNLCVLCASVVNHLLRLRQFSEMRYQSYGIVYSGIQKVLCRARSITGASAMKSTCISLAGSLGTPLG